MGLTRKLVRAGLLLTILVSLLISVLLCSLFFWLLRKGAKHRQQFSILLRMHCRWFVSALGVRVVRDPYTQAKSKRPALYLSNHISYLDILVLASQWDFGFLAKSEVSSWPVVGYVARCCGTIFVKRDSLFSRAMCIEKIYARLEAGRSVLVFPEGTTSVEGPRKKWRPFFSGSLSAAKWASADVKLVYLEYENVDEIAWLGDDALVPNLWKLLGRKSTRVRIREKDLEPIKSFHRREETRYTDSPRQMRLWLAEAGFSTF
jgi:1-acyl-sn-glycerol-3-phosphate acyltransferase